MSSNRRQFMKSLAVASAVAAITAKVEPASASPAENEGRAYDKYKWAKVEIKGEVATVTISNVDQAAQRGERSEQEHWELGELFAEMRGDPRFRAL